MVRGSQNNGGQLYYTVDTLGKGPLLVSSEDVRSTEEESNLQAMQARADVLYKVRAMEHVLALTPFPDMRKVTLPNDPSAFAALPKGARQFFACKPYRPADLGEAFDVWLRLNLHVVRMRFAWGPQFHPLMIVKFAECHLKMPEDARALNIGARGGENVERGPKGYVWFPAPPDVSIIRPEFRPKVTKQCQPGELEIGNARLVLGLMMMGFKLTAYTKKAKEEPTIPVFA